MTSKEALESWFSVISTQDKIRWEEHYKVIKKHLEVLDIIKKKNVATFLIPSCNNAHDYSMKTIGFEALTDKEFKLLKEWYENGKINKI